MAKKVVKTTKSARTAPRTVKKKEAPSESSSASMLPKLPGKRLNLRLKKTYLLWAAIIVGVVALLYGLRNFVIAATVNGQPISRISVVQELERQGGKQALNALVTKTLILQEARRQNLTVGQEEVDAEIKTIEDNIKRQGQTLEQALMLQGMTREQLDEQIRLQKMIEKIVGKDIKVTDQEVAQYIEQNREALPPEEDPKVQQDMVREQLQQQKLNERVNTWIEDLRKNAKVNSFVPYYP